MLTVTDPTPSGTTRFFTLALKKADGTPSDPPLQAFRTVFDMTSGEEAIITPEESIAVTTNVLEFKATDEENTVIHPENATEKRRIKIRATFGVGDAFTDYADYAIKRIDPLIA